MRNSNKYLNSSMVGFILFSLSIWFTSTLSIVVYYISNEASNGNILVISISVVFTIIFSASLCSLIDYIRRKRMISTPVNQILEATEKIASGDFSIKLNPNHHYLKYDEFDIIYENINTMTRELSKNEVLKNDFISSVSHEIKTPITVIQNYIKTLNNTNITKEKQQECINGILLQTNKLSTLITNILKLNKLENQSINPESKEFNLSELLRITTLSFEDLFDKKQLEIICDIDEIDITSDQSLLEIVFNNLISNAIKFTEPNGKIYISLKENNNNVIIKVQDTGCGISNETGKHIFEKFYQGDTSHSTEGNGLGLSLVKKVIDILGGEISVESKLNVGTTFTIRLHKGN